LQFISHYLGKGEFLPHDKIIEWLGKYGCDLVTRVEKICEDSVFVISGFDEEQFNLVSPVHFSYKVLCKTQRRNNDLRYLEAGRKFWELITFFPLIRYGPYRKRDQ
jgi:hypothetical protein